jgi:E3 ubiquitin-protein ligase HERC1
MNSKFFFSPLELRLEALHQILVLLSGMEEKGSISMAGSRSSSGFQSSTLLTSVRLQFLAGCFGLGTVGHAGVKGESGRLHHYQVGDSLQYVQILTIFL